MCRPFPVVANYYPHYRCIVVGSVFTSCGIRTNRYSRALFPESFEGKQIRDLSLALRLPRFDDALIDIIFNNLIFLQAQKSISSRIAITEMRTDSISTAANCVMIHHDASRIALSQVGRKVSSLAQLALRLEQAVIINPFVLSLHNVQAARCSTKMNWLGFLDLPESARPSRLANYGEGIKSGRTGLTLNE